MGIKRQDGRKATHAKLQGLFRSDGSQLLFRADQLTVFETDPPDGIFFGFTLSDAKPRRGKGALRYDKTERAARQSQTPASPKGPQTHS